MSAFEESIEAALAERRRAAAVSCAAAAREAEQSEARAAEWARSATPILAEARDALLRRDVVQGDAKLERQPEGMDYRLRGWPLSSMNGGRDWFLTTDANIYVSRLDHQHRLRLYLDPLKTSWFVVTYATALEGAAMSAGTPVVRWADVDGHEMERSLEDELRDRTVELVSVLGGQRETRHPQYAHADGTPIDPADLPNGIRARLDSPRT